MILIISLIHKPLIPVTIIKGLLLFVLGFTTIYSSSKTITDLDGIFISNLFSDIFLRFLNTVGTTVSGFSKVLQALKAEVVNTIAELILVKPFPFRKISSLISLFGFRLLSVIWILPFLSTEDELLIAGI